MDVKYLRLPADVGQCDFSPRQMRSACQEPTPLLYSVLHLPRLQNHHGRTRTITFNLARVAAAKKSTTEGETGK